jgi:hypothetical protein
MNFVSYNLIWLVFCKLITVYNFCKDISDSTYWYCSTLLVACTFKTLTCWHVERIAINVQTRKVELSTYLLTNFTYWWIRRNNNHIIKITEYPYNYSEDYRRNWNRRVRFHDLWYMRMFNIMHWIEMILCWIISGLIKFRALWYNFD